MTRAGISNLPAFPNPTIRKPAPSKAISWTHAFLWGFGCSFLAFGIASVVVWIASGVDFYPTGLSLIIGVLLLVMAAHQRRIDRMDRRIRESRLHE